MIVLSTFKSRASNRLHAPVLAENESLYKRKRERERGWGKEEGILQWKKIAIATNNNYELFPVRAA